jgi:hypothetical protein
MGRGHAAVQCWAATRVLNVPHCPFASIKGGFKVCAPTIYFTWMIQSSDGPGLRVGPGP